MDGAGPEEPVGPLKSDSLMRWVVLVLCCTAMIGNYYCFDNPAALKSDLESFVDISESEYNLLYTVYSIPNVVLPFFGGYFCDKFGARTCFIVFAALIGAGQVVVALGVSVKSIYLMYVGRVLFGLGGENMSVGSSVILEDWFRNKEFALAMGINLAISRIGSVVNNVVSPALASSLGLPTAFWFGAIVCGASLVCTVLIFPLDKQAEARVQAATRSGIINEGSEVDVDQSPLMTSGGDEVPRGSESWTDGPESAEAIAHRKHAEAQAALKGEATRTRSVSYSIVQEDLDKPDPKDEGFMKNVMKFGLAFWLLSCSCVVVYATVIPFNSIASTLLMERNYFRDQPHDSCALEHPHQCQSGHNQPNEHCNDGDYWKPPLPLNGTNHDGKYYPNLKEDDVVCADGDDWTKGCTKDYCDAYETGVTQADLIMSIPYFMSAVLSPILGGVVDYIGGRALICIASAAVLILVHMLLGAALSVSPVGPLVGQGVAYSMFAAALWPSVPYVVPSDQIGLAYGVLTAVQNLGLAVVPLLVAAVFDASGHEYIPNVEYLFVAFAGFGAVTAIVLCFVAPHLNLRKPPSFEEWMGLAPSGEYAGLDNKIASDLLRQDI